MEFIHLILHLDKYLGEVVNQYHNYFYAILFLVIFAETGLVVTPFLPGDSLLFVAGGLAASGHLDFAILAGTIFAAAFLGDNSNFFIGKFLGETLFKNPKSKIFRRDILNKTHDFYERNGRKTVIIARFLPLIRTFAPFVAGVGHMKYVRFIGFSFIGSFLWVGIFLGGGFLFGNIPFIKTHLSIIILLVMILSVLPIFKMVFDEIKLNKANG
jgi:membrane-associated protein